MTRLDTSAAIESVDMTVSATLPEGWSVRQLWDALVEAGNDPNQMKIVGNEIIVYAGKGLPHE